ncbi:MAG: DUF2203 domain-containing protein [Solirubrobacterales bacterium]
MEHSRHFTVEEANALLPRVEPVLERLREAKGDLTDEEAHAVLAEAGPTNGGGDEGRRVGEAFLEVRRLVGTLNDAGIVIRDIDRGLIDFPALIDETEVYLCWELGEDEITHFHDLDAGFDGRKPLS